MQDRCHDAFEKCPDLGMLLTEMSMPESLPTKPTALNSDLKIPRLDIIICNITECVIDDHLIVKTSNVKYINAKILLCEYCLLSHKFLTD